MKLRLFAHSWRSDWNHGNAHFLRGLAYELMTAGHDVRCYEPENSWSFIHLLEEGERGRLALEQFNQCFPDLDVRTYDPVTFEEFAKRELRDADVVVVHEWNSPEVVGVVLELKSKFHFVALFHDTHHRAYTSPKEIALLNVDRFDGVLAFGAVVRQIYHDVFKARRAWTFHEGADIAHFLPIASDRKADVSWIGNWGDEERTHELNEFLIEPLSTLQRGKATVYGVRYPEDAKKRLQESGVEYRGYLPNLNAPGVYSRSVITLHIPRRFYANGLRGIPTIRMFEAMACGVPLICSPWTDTERLFRPNEDYVCVPDGRSMLSELQRLIKDDGARQQLAASALETIRKHHTCAHRANQFLEICQELAK
ncbi:MAG: glycosyltransferase [Terriglobales bacterium]